MYKVTTIFERPSAEVPYFLTTKPETRNDFSDFTSTIPELLLLNVVDETPLKQVSEAFYADEESFNVFMNKFNERFPSFFLERDTYNASVGIITTRTTENL